MYTYPYPRPSVTVDIAIFVPENDKFKLLLIQRAQEPFKGLYALPGGFLDINETLEETARREILEETGLKTPFLTQVHTFSELERDPRGRVITTCFATILENSQLSKIQAGSDAEKADWFDVNQLPPLAFDHSIIIQEVVEKFLNPQNAPNKGGTRSPRL